MTLYSTQFGQVITDKIPTTLYPWAFLLRALGGLYGSGSSSSSSSELPWGSAWAGVLGFEVALVCDLA